MLGRQPRRPLSSPFMQRRSSTSMSTSDQVFRSNRVTTYLVGSFAGNSERRFVLRKSAWMAPSNSAIAEIADSSQQLPTLPCWMSLGWIEPTSLMCGTSRTPCPRPGWRAWPRRLPWYVILSVCASATCLIFSWCSRAKYLACRYVKVPFAVGFTVKPLPERRIREYLWVSSGHSLQLLWYFRPSYRSGRSLSLASPSATAPENSSITGSLMKV
mmetsp:Transcript_95945/g.248061  ORF Transcript_95945/g.248061 Transcript_95945/m.248061 type:complete len:214 (-) Transcript_95945:276-917(-)